VTPARRRPQPRRLAVCTALAAALALACAPLTVQEEKDLGRQVQRQVREQMTFVRDPVTVQYVRSLGQQLVNASPPSPFEFRFYVVEDETLNAFAVPGGAVYVHTGLINTVRDAAELAGVLAHEIGHVTSRHVAKMARRGRNTGVAAQVVSLLVAILTGNPYIADAGNVATSMAAQAYMSTYTQDAELEADRLAIDTMIRAGFDPQALISMFETLQQEHAGGVAMPGFLSSHPAPAERIQEVGRLIAARRPPPGLRRDDNGRLEIIQARLELIIGTDVEELSDDE
jgi:predicted Zn-dependent protease